MSDTEKIHLFNIEAFIRSEGVSSDIIFLDSMILSNNNMEFQSEKLKLLIENIKSRKNGD